MVCYHDNRIYTWAKMCLPAMQGIFVWQTAMSGWRACKIVMWKSFFFTAVGNQIGHV